MSSCDNCDCSDKTQCAKKGNSYTFDIVETQESYKEVMMMENGGEENDCKCKCGSTCSCTNCTCCPN